MTVARLLSGCRGVCRAHAVFSLLDVGAGAGEAHREGGVIAEACEPRFVTFSTVMRLHRSGLGPRGFVLCVMDAYTGGRWGELAGQQRHEYDSGCRAIAIRQPLKEVSGKLFKGGVEVVSDGRGLEIARVGRPKVKKGRTKTPAGTRTVELPPGLALLYEELLDGHPHPFVLCTSAGMPWRRSNFRQRFWRPAWDGNNPDQPYAEDHVAPILRCSPSMRDAIRMRRGSPRTASQRSLGVRGLGQKMKGIARIYDHVTPMMRQQIRDVLEARWLGSLVALSAAERAELVSWFPHLRMTFD